jgi:hypothetical protein
VLLGIVVAAVLLFRGCVALVFSDENEAAGKSIAAAVEAFRQEQGRYPERLEELRPKYLAAIPQAGEHFGIVYAADSAGKQCWVAYQVHRDSFEEYDCQKRAWLLVEYEDSQAVRHPKAEWIRPTGR